MKGDHVVVETGTQAFLCKHCGDRYAPAIPAPLAMYVAMMKVFAQHHRHCKPVEAKP